MYYSYLADKESMKAYSMDLRERVLRAWQQKQGSQREIAKTFGVSLSWLEGFLRRYRKTNSIAPLAQGGDHCSIFKGENLERLEQAVSEHPDATLNELKQLCGAKCTPPTIWRALKNLGLTRKKRRYVPANKTVLT